MAVLAAPDIDWGGNAPQSQGTLATGFNASHATGYPVINQTVRAAPSFDVIFEPPTVSYPIGG